MFKKLLPKFTAIFMICILFISKINIKAETTGNNYPIILVNGMAGIERDKLFGLKYYGGVNDIQNILNNKGFKTFSAFTGPFSSNWDQAIEIYYYIKGGTVDYGAAHSKKFGHERFGTTYDGIYPDWDGINKVHFVGFSTGGTATRLLDELLRYGDEDEIAYFKEHPKEGISPLFQDSKRKWIHSITSLATAHNGSTAFEIYDKNPISLKQFILNIAAISEYVYASPVLYDYKMGQWGIRRKLNESFFAYMNRIYSSNIWNSEDTCFNDLQRKGAEELNNRSSAHPDMYYFSYHGDSTYKGLGGNHYPIASTNILYTYGALVIGSNKDSTLPYGYEAWRASDGAANVISSKYPFNQPHKNFDGNVERGVWYVYPTLVGWDHFDFLGISHALDFDPVENLYTNIAQTLQSLPKS